ncbi:phage tail tape measure protein [Terribacillus sp. 7520-G]|uniref:phage tail tape measure protein n=1 Tax=Terribacillus sp. 7520-G TaxID=2025389 RepID=UPI000BA583BE|nr:phage tail tape measure protein [Terribacillus sp. 7520-G]PAD39819.1 hypothetical protein CHH53_04045 [Terribacillus sp. 7520-G]
MAEQGKPLGSMIIDLGLSDTKFEKSLDGIRRQLKATQAQTRASLSVISQAGDGYETMKVKVDGLTKEMSINEQQIKVLRDRYEKARKTYGDGSKAVQNYAKQVNDAVAKQSVMQKSLQDAELKMLDFKRGTNDAKVELDQLKRSMTAQIKTLDMQGKKHQAARKEYILTKQSHQQLGVVIDKEKEKLKDLIRIKGEDSREAKEQSTKIAELKGEYKQLGVVLDGIKADYGKASKAGAKFADSMSEIKEEISGVADVAKTAGKSMLGITAGVGAVGGLATLQASNVEASQNRIQASLGATGEVTKELSKVTQDVFKKGWGDDLTDVSRGIVTVRQHLGELNDADLKSVTESGYLIRDLWGYDIQESARSAGTMMKNFGIDGKTSMDLIVKAFQSGGDFSNELLDTINEYSPQFASMGYDAERMFDIFITGAQNGAFNLDKVGDAVKEFNIRAQDGSQTTADGFAAIGMNATDMGAKIAAGGEEGEKAFQATVAGLAAMDSDVERNIAGVNLFGTQWEDLREDVILAMADSEGALGKYGGAADKAKEQMKTGLVPALQELKREGSLALAPLGEALGDIVKDSIPPLVEAIKNVTGFFTGMPPGMQKVTLGFAGIAAAIAPLTIGLGFVAGGISKIAGVLELFGLKSDKSSKKLGFLTKIFDKLKFGLVALTGPIGIAVAAIAAIATGVVIAYKKIKPFREFVDGIGTSIMKAFGKVKDFFSGDILGNIKNLIPPSLLPTITSFADGMSSAFQTAKSLALDAFGAISTFA